MGSQHTTNYDLEKFDGNEIPDNTKFNANSDKIDAGLKSRSTSGAGAPSSTTGFHADDRYYDTTNKKEYRFTGTSWEMMESGKTYTQGDGIIIGADNKISVDDTREAKKADLDTHIADAVKHITADERTGWNAKSKVVVTPVVTTGEEIAKIEIDDSAPISIKAQKITVDSALSDTSENPAQNKIIKAAIDGKSKVAAKTSITEGATEAKGFTIDDTTYNFPSGGIAEVTWGSIKGTLANQTDLKNAMDAKLDKMANDPSFDKVYIHKKDNTEGSVIIAEQIDSNGLVSGNIVKNYVDTQDQQFVPKNDIVNDLTTGGATKVASAETVKTLNTTKAEIDDLLSSSTVKTYSIDKIIALLEMYGASFRGSFATKAALDAYSGPKDKNDRAIVQEDETHSSETTMYEFDGTAWVYLYSMKMHFSTAQWAAIDSGITATKVAKYDAYESKIDGKLDKTATSGTLKTEITNDGNMAYTVITDNGEDRTVVQQTQETFDAYITDGSNKAELIVNKSGAYVQKGSEVGVTIKPEQEVARKGDIDQLANGKLNKLPEEPFSHTEYKFPFHIEDPVQNAENITAKFHTLVINDGTTRNQYTITLPAAVTEATAESPNGKAGLFTKAIYDEILSHTGGSDLVDITAQLVDEKFIQGVLTDEQYNAIKGGKAVRMTLKAGEDERAKAIAITSYDGVADCIRMLSIYSMDEERVMVVGFVETDEDHRTFNGGFGYVGNKIRFDTTTAMGVSTAKSVIINGEQYNFPSGGSATWGGITGTLSEQTDLNTALEEKIKKLPLEPFSQTEYKFPFHIETPVQNASNITAKFHTLEINNGTKRDEYTIMLPSAEVAATAEFPDGKAGLYTKSLHDNIITKIDDLINDTLESATTTWSSDNLKNRFAALAGIVSIKVVTERPEPGEPNTMYYVGTASPYHIWLCTEDPAAGIQWTDMGSTSIDLTNYYTKEQADATFLKLTGGTVSGTITTSNALGMNKTTNADYLTITAGTNNADGANVGLNGSNAPTNPGDFLLRAIGGGKTATLRGKPDGTLTWEKSGATNPYTVLTTGNGYTSSYIENTFLKLKGGTITGPIVSSMTSGGSFKMNRDNGYLEFDGGTDYKSGHIAIYGKNQSALPGACVLTGNNGTQWYQINILPATRPYVTSSTFTENKTLMYTDEAYTKTEADAKYLALTGGTMTGTIVTTVGNGMRLNVDGGALQFYGSTGPRNGARLVLEGRSSTGNGAFTLEAAKSSTEYTQLVGRTSGTLTWNNKAVLCEGDANKVSVSDTGTATETVGYITIDGVEKKLAGGSGGDSSIVNITAAMVTETAFTGTITQAQFDACRTGGKILAVTLTDSKGVPVAHAVAPEYVDVTREGFSAMALITYDSGLKTVTMGKISIGKDLSVKGDIFTIGGGSSSVEWGNILGTLGNQTDLNAALSEKASAEALGNLQETVDRHAQTLEELNTNKQDKSSLDLDVGSCGYIKEAVLGINMNGSSITLREGIADLGTVITEHQDISGKQNKVLYGTTDPEASQGVDGDVYIKYAA